MSLYRRWADLQLNRRGCLELVKSRPPNAMPPISTDLWFLYKIVKQRKPQCILEFGSGCSTVILAQALNDNGSGMLYSIESELYWTEATKHAIPEPLLKFCEVLYSPLLEVDFSGVPAFRHSKIPNVAPDFLYLDGPALTPERQLSVDVIDIENRFPPGFLMVVDGRKKNTAFLRQNLKRQYVYKQSRWFGHSRFELKTI